METSNHYCNCENLTDVSAEVASQGAELSEIWAAISELQSVTMEYPTLMRGPAWMPINSKRPYITAIRFVDSYTPTGSEDDVFAIDVDGTGSIIAYQVGTEITVAGNGSGKIRMNENSRGMFANMPNLERIEGLEVLDASGVTHFNGAFNFCHKLVDVDISMWKVPKLENMNGMFNECNLLETVKMPQYGIPAATTTNGVFLDCPKLREVDFGRGVTVLTQDTFRNCPVLEKVSGLDSVTTIGDSAFRNCYALKDVGNLSSVTTIGASAFRDCSSLKRVNGLENVTTIGDHAFYKCLALEELNGLGNLTTVGQFAFLLAPMLTEININPQKLTAVGESAFRLSSVEDSVALLAYPGTSATRLSRWSADELVNIQAISVPDVYLEVPYPDSQLKYTEMTYTTIENEAGEEVAASVANLGCAVLSMYHLWQVVNRNSEELFTNFADWFNTLIDPDGTLAASDWMSTQITTICGKLGWGRLDTEYVSSSQQKELLIQELNAGHPVMIMIKGPAVTENSNITNYRPLHAVTVIGSDSATGKFAIMDSGVTVDGGVVYWLAFEDLFMDIEGVEEGQALNRIYPINYDLSSAEV